MADVDLSIECWYKGCKYPEVRPTPEYPFCKKSCSLYLEMNYMIMNCGEPDSYRYLIPLKPSADDEKSFDRLFEIKSNIESFVQQGKNLYISSLYKGSSKTTWSLKLMYKYFDEVWCGNSLRIRGYFLDVPTFLRKLKTFSYRETAEFKRIDRLLETVDIVIWDDITSKKSYTDAELDMLDSYISTRYRKKLTNIFNGMEVTDLSACVGDSIAERIKKCEHILINSDYSEGI